MQNRFSNSLAFVLIVLASANAGGAGLSPRSDARFYRGQNADGLATVAASVLTFSQTKGAFRRDVTPRYVVVEVAAYPGTGTELAIGPDDFSLRDIDDNTFSRAADAATVAAVIVKPVSQSPVNVSPSVGIGYETATGDGIDGQRRRSSGVYTTAGVGVGVGQPRGRTPADFDRDELESALAQREFPQTRTKTPVAGYLYFPLPSKKKDSNYELIFQGPVGELRIRAGRR